MAGLGGYAEGDGRIRHEMTLFAEVILPLPLDQTFLYSIPEAHQAKAKVGSRVLVPLKQSFLTGIIVGLRKKGLSGDLKIKEIESVLDEAPLLSSGFLSFTRKLSDYYYSSWGEILLSSLPSSFVLKSKVKITITDDGKKNIRRKPLSQTEKKILSLLQRGSYSDFYLRRKSGVKNISSVLSSLERKGMIQIQRDIKMPPKRRDRTRPPVRAQMEIDFSLDSDSKEICNSIYEKMESRAFSPFYLYGSTEKRKAVYLNLMDKSLSFGKNVLLLVPEISLTESYMENILKKLGKNVAHLHSQLTERMKEDEWSRIKNGETGVVVGPRSALFSPLEDIGLIIVDEEQDESYYQHESPSYDARKGAWMRALEERSVLVYGSSIPSIESFFRAREKDYLLPLEFEPVKYKISIIHHAEEKKIISTKLEQRLRKRIERGEQALLFINRRGYASYLICSKCGAIPRCKQCDIALSYHKKEDQLICHYCNSNQNRWDKCPECRSEIIRKRGFGVESVEAELKELFPESRMACFDTDTASTKKEQAKRIADFKRGKTAVLIGTQFLAHRSDLPPVSFAAVLQPESMLTFSDFKAGQRTFQNMNMMKRHMRNEAGSELVVQTAIPEQDVIIQSTQGDYDSFFRREIEYRRMMDYPPFSCMAEILIEGRDLRILALRSREILSVLKNFRSDIEILGPAFAPVAKMKGKNRVQIFLRSSKKARLDNAVKEALKGIRLKKTITLYE
jgi:primosomal protein N' (replication factor Y)